MCMNRFNVTKNKNYLMNHRGIVIGAFCVIIVLMGIVSGPKTVASGNGYSHQIGSFGDCDMKFDDCQMVATHRRHHFFGNEDYCDSCWDGYGENMFEGLSGIKSDSDSHENDDLECRYVGCGERAKYSEWARRYCSVHIQETHYCRYPGCNNEISNYSSDLYCNEH